MMMMGMMMMGGMMMGGGMGMMGGGMGMMGMMGGGMGMMGGGMAGVYVDAEGVLKRATLDPTGAITAKRFRAVKAAAKKTKRSKFRKISLNRLEAAMKARAVDGKKPLISMHRLAGLTRIEYVFFLPETNDIVIAGPAEPWFVDGEGVSRGIDTLQPTLLLEDLVVALRAYQPGGRPTGKIGCSIDSTKEGQVRLREFLSKVGPREARNVKFLTNGIRQSLGMQNVSIIGVPPDTRFAQIMLSADYRMKLIGIGLERTPVGINSYVDYVKTSRSSNAIVRWFFTPDYKCARVSEDGLALKLVGDTVKLVNADEIVGPDGNRLPGGKPDAASRKFVKGFTEKYPELAAKVTVYAQLKQMIDFSVVAAFIQKQDFYGKSGWSMDFLADEKSFQVRKYHTPKQVETAVTAVVKGNRLMTPLGGGVTIFPQQALTSSNLMSDEDGDVTKIRESIKHKDFIKGEWWWWD